MTVTFPVMALLELEPNLGPLTRYVKLWVAHAPGMPVTFFPPPTSKETASYRSRHASRHVPYARAVMHVGIANPRWRGKRSRHSRRMRNSLLYVSGKRPIVRNIDGSDHYHHWCWFITEMNIWRRRIIDAEEQRCRYLWPFSLSQKKKSHRGWHITWSVKSEMKFLTHPKNFIGCAGEVWEWIRNCIPHSMINVKTYNQ